MRGCIEEDGVLFEAAGADLIFRDVAVNGRSRGKLGDIVVWAVGGGTTRSRVYLDRPACCVVYKHSVGNGASPKRFTEIISGMKLAAVVPHIPK